jgi:cytochrome b561
VLLTTFSGWLFASARGWSVSWFFVAPLPMLTSGNRALVKVLNGWHQNFMWALLVVAGLHVAAAFVHLFYYQWRHAADAAGRAGDWSVCRRARPIVE